MSTRVDLLNNITPEAGRRLLDYYNKDQKEIPKSETDFALEADIAIEKFILDEIKKMFPHDSILSEEAGEDNKQSDYLWIVDPLDGTANFKAKIPYFCSTISLQYKDQLVAAGVYDPINAKYYFSELNKGAYLNGNPIKVSEVSVIRKYLISYSTSNHKNREIVKKGSELFNIFLNECRAVRLQGSSILDLCNVASGTFDGLVKVGSNFWDFAAGCLIVEGAKGVSTDLAGDKWSRNSIDIFVSNGTNHQVFIDMFNNHITR